MIIRFFKMIWIVFNTQVLLRVPLVIAALIVAFPLIIFLLVFKYYEHLFSEEVIPVIYMLASFLILAVFLITIIKRRSKEHQETN